MRIAPRFNRWPMCLICLIALLTGTVQTGCASLFRATPVYSESAIDAIRAKYWDKTPEAMIGRQKTAARRNEIMADLLTVSDHYYNEFKTHFHVGRAAIQSGFDLTAIGLDTAATFSSSGVAPILSATSAAVQGTQGKLSNRLFFDNTTLAIINEMDAMRAEKRALLERNMARSYHEYPIQQGVGDVLDYHNGGSVINALVQLVARSGAKKEEAEANLKQIKTDLAEASTDQIALRRQITTTIGAMTDAQALAILGDGAKFNISGDIAANAKRRLLDEVNRRIDATRSDKRIEAMNELLGWLQ